MVATNGGDAEQQRDAGGDGRAEREQQDEQRAAHRELLLLGLVRALRGAERLAARTRRRAPRRAARDAPSGRRRRPRAGASATFSSASCSSSVSTLPGSVKVTSDRAAVLGDGVGAVGRVERALDVGDALDLLEPADDVLDRGRDLQDSSALIEPLPWIEHALADLVGEVGVVDDRCRGAWTRRCPSSDDSRFCWPTLPPIMVARTTNRIQPRMAVLRCVALHRAGARREVAGLHLGSSSRGVVGTTAGGRAQTSQRSRPPPMRSLRVRSPLRCGSTRPAVRPAAPRGAADRASR